MSDPRFADCVCGHPLSVHYEGCNACVCPIYSRDVWQLTVGQVSELVGVKPATFRSYVSRGQAPKPDGHLDQRTPYWKFSTISQWRREKDTPEKR